ncbi:MAG: diadenylate cyclase CdaA [Oscillospiraceae bacterium]|nr:diadenylate cyclase CdaA [Oscillospiraceae bacterium]
MFLNDIIISAVAKIGFLQIVDILIVSYILYKLYMIIKETRAEQLLKGVGLILILMFIANSIGLDTLSWLLQNTIYVGLMAIVIIFQPEVRRALEQLGRSTFRDSQMFQNSDEQMEKVIIEIVDAVENMSKAQVGALIAIVQKTGVGEIIKTGVVIDAKISSELLENIFVVNTPLHDGAVIIKNDRIAAAACFLPLTQNENINKKLGTRHRAGIGLSEISDALVVIVSEETGNISLVINGNITRNYDKNRLKEILIKILQMRRNNNSDIKEKVKGVWKLSLPRFPKKR